MTVAMASLWMQPPDSVPPRRGAVAVIVESGRFLVIRRSQHVVAPLMHCFPGGGIEAGESEQEALVREIDEELGAAIEPMGRVWQSVTPWGVALAWWQARLGSQTTIVPNPAEVASFHWYTAEAMAALPDLLESNHAFLAALAGGQISLRGD